jgi:D-alanyl-D-alanine carboxypeptidase/D-alanyl-D-alanine-endopeptidase (penicillin-binding protein 4)
LILLASIAGVHPAYADWRALAALEEGGARVTATVMDLSTQTVIQQLHPDTRLTPASVTKLTVAATALSIWPADKMFQTRVLSSGPLRAGEIEGDLLLVGAGDPSLTGQDLWGLAAQIRAAGIRSVHGHLVVVPAPFPSVGCETKDRCDTEGRGDRSYNAPVASVGIDYGNWCVDVRSNPAGGPAIISSCSAAHLPIAVEGTVQTISARADGTPWVARSTDASGMDGLRVGGSIPSGTAQQMYCSMSNPALGTGLLLKETLHELGIEIQGSVVVREGNAPRDAYPLAQIEGLSLKEQLGRMLRFSNNYIADVLTLTMASEINAHPPKTLADASVTLSDFVWHAERGLNRNASPPMLRSGSGLTPENGLSANDVVSVLAYEYRDTRDFNAFYGGLVVPRQAPFPFLRSGGANWLDRVALKPGTMGDPYSVCGIAGYLRKKDGGWMAFAVIINGSPRIRHVPLYKAMAAIHKDIEQLLARY